MTIPEVYQKFRHLDHLLSDLRWLTDDEDTVSPLQMQILRECWAAIRDERQTQPVSVSPPPTSTGCCCDAHTHCGRCLQCAIHGLPPPCADSGDEATRPTP